MLYLTYLEQPQGHPCAVKWPNATVPTRTTTANRTDAYTFFTYDNGTTWWGNLSLYNYS